MKSMFAQGVCSIGTPEKVDKHLCPVSVEGREVQALLDTGSMITLVKASLVNSDSLQTQTVGVTCIHGETREYNTARVTIGTVLNRVPCQVAIIPTLMYDVILGRDFPSFWELWEKRVKEPTVVTVSGERTTGVTEPELHEVLSSPDKAVFPFDVMSGDTETTDVSGEPEERVENVLADIKVSRDNFATAQLNDPTLARARENVKIIDGVLIYPDVTLAYPHIAMQNNLLYQVDKQGEDIVEQLIVPKPFRKMVLDLAHGHLLGGHLGMEKTKERILMRFFWPGLVAEVRDYCTSCPECQYTSPAPNFRSPLVPLPIVEVPFERIAMDLVGPIVKSARGHQYILVILDYATRYPEAIPLRNMTAKTIAKELVLVFSRVGIPKEILTDQGTPFMSRVTKELCRLFRVKHIRTSVYHPQTDGLVERFNKTLKNMLRKVIAKDGRDWDCLLPYLLFAVREVPQSSTGFSPFELLYGRQPRGLLDIAKETWEHESTPYRSVIEHVSQMQDRIKAVMPLVREHMQQAQQAQSRIYNRGAKLRQFSPGDRVLVLIPTVESKFLAKWQGPFTIVKKISEVNYLVHQPGKRKPEQNYHINLLKPWKDRETLVVNSAPRSYTVPEVRIAESLFPHQKQEAQEFVMRNNDFFSELPGLTHVIKHDIVTEPSVKVKIKPYRVPEARREVITQEINKMLDLGVIEESVSEWSSPIVLIPKSDGSIRFCNDYRQLNLVSKFDAYPMARVDELIDKLGGARYLTTLDLTKGYWQIPLTERAKEKTAFSAPSGHFQYTRLPFGLHGAPATFQRMMDRILRPHGGYASAYLDDVIIYTSDWESHLPKVQAVVDSLRQAGLTANPKKCTIGLEEAMYLGYTIGRGLIKPQLNKIDAIQNWPRPLNKKQVRSFLGIAGYYRRFIPNFASMAVPLTDLTKGKNSVMIKWTPEAERAFQSLKQALCSQPVLVCPDFHKPFSLQTDASEAGLGAVLSQIIDGEEHPVLYISRKLNDHEKRYATVEKEALAIKWALDALKYYLLGREFSLITDHAPLKWMQNNKEKNSRVTRWFLSLQPFRFTVQHRAGSLQGNVDGLSRTFCLSSQGAPTHRLVQEGGKCGVSQGEVIEGRYVSPRFLAYAEESCLRKG